MIFDMREYYKMLQDHQIQIIYSGPIWADGMDGLVDTLRKRLELDALTMPATQSIFSVFIEQMNNILMYSAERQQFQLEPDRHMEVSTGVFVLGSRGNTYFIQSGNVMHAESVDYVRQHIDYLNTLDKQQLRQYYREQIKARNPNPESKGAGLGLIEIARRSSSQIQYQFLPWKPGKVFFVLYVEIGGVHRSNTAVSPSNTATT